MSNPALLALLGGALGVGYLLEKLLPFLKASKSSDIPNGDTRKRVEDLCDSMDNVVGGLNNLSIHFDYQKEQMTHNSGTLEQIRDGIRDLNSNLKGRPCVHD